VGLCRILFAKGSRQPEFREHAAVGLPSVEPVCARPQKPGRPHRGDQNRDELWFIPAKRVLSGRRKIIKLALSGKLASFLKQAYQRLEEWLSRTAPQLSLSMDKRPPWLLFDPTQATQSAVT
jgi:hypothetical protein